MKKLNKTLSIILASLMIVSAVPMAFATECEHGDGVKITAGGPATQVDGFCDYCGVFVGHEINAGETYGVMPMEYVKFVPEVSGNYVFTVEGDGAVLEAVVFTLCDENLNTLYYTIESDFVETIRFEAGEVYYFNSQDYFGSYATVVSVECETHTGTVQTCYGYVCDGCGTYFGEPLGHDIITDEYKAPTCTQTGLTEGEHCSRCDDKTIAQEIIPELGHINEDGDTICERCSEVILCKDCFRPVHDSFADSIICWFIMLINLVKSVF